MKRYGWVLVVVCVLCLVLANGVRAEGLCPPTDTAAPPPTAWEPTPSSPPEDTWTPPPGDTPIPSEPPIRSVTPGIEVDPTPTETPGATTTPPENGDTPREDEPTAVTTLPVTGGGPVGSWQLTVVGGAVLLGVAFLARMMRRARDADR